MGTKAGLTLESVVAAAAEIADREGLEALTLARLAATLGVKPPSLFNHVNGMPALRRELRLLALSALGDALASSAIGKSRGDGVRAMAATYRAFVRKHPGIYAEILTAIDDDDREMAAASDRIISVCMSVMNGYALSRRETIHAIRALRSIGHGFASLEAARGFGMPINIDQSYEWLVDNFITGLDAAQARGEPRTSRTAEVARDKARR
jgi:AcrR family transcriptional regulator